MSLSLSRIGSIGIGVGLCPLPVPQVGMVITGSPTVTSGSLSQAFTTCIVLAGCQIAIGTIVTSSATATSGGLGMARVTDSFVGSFNGVLVDGNATSICGG